MGIFSSLFELKASNQNSGGMYPQIVRMHGASPQYTDGKYRNIAKYGYSENFVIYRCLQEIIKACIQLDWCVMKYNSKGEPEEIPGHPVQKLLEKPNRIYPQAEMLKRIIAFYYIAGDVPLIKYTLSGNRVDSFYAYRPDKVTFTLTGNPDQPYSDIRYEGQNAQNVDPNNFTLFKNFNPIDTYDGLGRGMSPLKPILKNGDLLDAMLTWNLSLLQNGANVSGVVSVDPDVNLSETQYRRAREQINDRYSGKDKVGSIMLLEGGSKFMETSKSPKDMDWANGKLSIMKDIIVGMGLDPIVVGLNDQSSYNNKNEAMKSLYTNVAIPLMQELADTLGPFLGLEEDEYLGIKYDHIPVLQEDMKELIEKLNSNTFMTINEKRAKMGLEPKPNGDVIVPSGNYAMIDKDIYLPTSLIPIEEVTQQQPSSSSGKPNNSNNEDTSKDENKSMENFLY